MVQNIESHIRKALPEGRLLLCVSGGADSMALLHACRCVGRSFVVAHCDFHLRGLESERDRRFVALVCRRLGCECVQLHFDVPEYMRLHGVSEEMACRELRYAEFRRLKGKYGCVRIVTAHNRDDNDETMLLNLFRGTGLKGLCGMSEDTGEIARPLLAFSRKEIEEYLSAINARHITDSSNLSTEYRRNFIRRELLPEIESRWPGIRKSLARTRKNLTESMRLCSTAMAESKSESATFISAKVYNDAPSRPLLLMDWLESRGVSSTQIDEMAQGLKPGRKWLIADSVVLMKSDGLHILPLQESERKFRLTECELTEELMRRIRSQRGDKVLYYAGGEELSFRTVRPGDRIAPFGMKGTKLVSDLLREAGVPEPYRADYKVAVDASDRIIWIPGVRRSRYLSVNPKCDKTVFILSEKSE
ncbi:MAG: tRNA lysidine(34) synthetase TilS [Prevotella sp.]|nr:tRNA lysidine(34) synthetase TilS [Prevotella sp.]MCM1074411.1 tRNA lysidine(34) synthetase TilS [Ruminococcus sp.]